MLCNEYSSGIKHSGHSTLTSTQLTYFEQNLKKINPHKILDLGCGNGGLGKFLKPYCTTLHGVDFSEKNNEACYDQVFSMDYQMYSPNHIDLMVSVDSLYLVSKTSVDHILNKSDHVLFIKNVIEDNIDEFADWRVKDVTNDEVIYWEKFETFWKDKLDDESKREFVFKCRYKEFLKARDLIDKKRLIRFIYYKETIS